MGEVTGYSTALAAGIVHPDQLPNNCVTGSLIPVASSKHGEAAFYNLGSLTYERASKLFERKLLKQIFLPS